MSENEPKKETVRINLPPRPNLGEAAPPPKKETVRINLPARPALGANPPEGAKRESSKITNLAKPPVLTPKPMTPPAPPAGIKPPPPNAPRPALPGAATVAPAGGPPRPPGAPAAPGALRPPGAPAAPGAPGAPRPMAPTSTLPQPPRPAAPAGGPPRPPGAPAAPGAPRPPGVPAPTAPSADPAAETVAGGSLKETEKKNTARIELPPAAPSMPTPAARPTAMPPAQTVKIQQTQPLRQAPTASEVRTLPPSQPTYSEPVEAEDDKTVMMVSIGVLLFSIVAFAFQLMTYLAE